MGVSLEQAPQDRRLISLPTSSTLRLAFVHVVTLGNRFYSSVTNQMSFHCFSRKPCTTRADSVSDFFSLSLMRKGEEFLGRKKKLALENY